MRKITYPATFRSGIIEICGGEYESLNQSKSHLRLEKKKLACNKYFLGNNHMFTTISTHSDQSLSRVRLFARESQHARPPCPSPTPGAHSDS